MGCCGLICSSWPRGLGAPGRHIACSEEQGERVLDHGQSLALDSPDARTHTRISELLSEDTLDYNEDAILSE